MTYREPWYWRINTWMRLTAVPVLRDYFYWWKEAVIYGLLAGLILSLIEHHGRLW